MIPSPNKFFLFLQCLLLSLSWSWRDEPAADIPIIEFNIDPVSGFASLPVSYDGSSIHKNLIMDLDMKSLYLFN